MCLADKILRIVVGIIIFAWFIHTVSNAGGKK